MSLVSLLTAPCPACIEPRRLLAEAWNLIQRDPVGVLTLKNPEVAAPPDRLQCGICRNRGVVLTAEGIEMVKFIGRWTAKDIPEELPL